MGGQRGTLEQRFWRKVVKTDGCWEWTGGKSEGYGAICCLVDGHWQMRGAHIVSYELHVGPVPNGLQLDHICENKGCVRPAHLEPVTWLENIKRASRWAGNKVACDKGHELYRRPNGGRRYCKVCAADRRREQRRLSDPSERVSA